VSRGFGSKQQQILDDLRALPKGYGVLLTDTEMTAADSASFRRAAHALERLKLIRITKQLIDGRLHLVAHLA